MNIGHVTTIALTKRTVERLQQLKGYADTYEHVIVRLLEQYKGDNADSSGRVK